MIVPIEKFCFALRIVNTTPKREYIDFVMERCFHMEKEENVGIRNKKRVELSNHNLKIEVLNMKNSNIYLHFCSFPALNILTRKVFELYCWGDYIYNDNHFLSVSNQFFKSLLVSFPEFKKTVPDEYMFTIDKQEPGLIYL